MFDNLKGPVGVIAVAGQYRTGKSYLLNRMLLNRQKGFGVGPTINPCTKGLWIWGTPIQGCTPDGEPINVLVVDSEGIGGLDEDNNHDMRIFSLAMLLSSYFLYNSVGSIDENALSNLSLVTNLTKHIQFKSSTSQEKDEDDIEVLIQYLPSFMWVVRDFALQLCDEDGNEINSKEYLERALLERGSDSKNEIRKHLKKFFKDRECCTMIRPLTNEEELQNLEQMDLEELRSEFVDQVMVLRRKVLNQIKPKTINNQVLTGSQWLGIVEQYVIAINEGCVPNIQSSWIYICRQNANQALDQCKSFFENEISEVIQFPMNQEDLDNILGEQKEAAVQKLVKLISNDPEIMNEFKIELVTQLDEKIGQMVKQNQYECKQYATDLLNQLFTEFDSQVKSQQAFDIHQLEETLKEVQQVYDQNALDFSEKQVLLCEAKASFLYDILFYFTKRLESDFQLQRQLDIQTKERLEIQLKEAKEDSRSERIKIEERLRQALIDKSELEANLSFAKEQFESLKTVKEQDDQEYQQTIRQLKDQTSTQTDDYRLQKDEFEDKIQLMQRHLLQVESEIDKERALFDQKVEFLEKSIQEKTSKERDYLAQRQSHKSGLSSELKQLQQKYEADLKILQSSLDEEKERAQELENTLKTAQLELTEKSDQYSTQEIQYKTLQQQSQDQIRQMEITVQGLKRDNDSKFTLQAKEKEDKVELQAQQIQDLESQLKDITEQIKQKEHEYKKESAIKDQKYEFLEMQLQDCKDQLDESYKQHEQVVKAMKQDHHGDDDGKRKLSPSKFENLQQELQKTQEQYQEELLELKTQNEFYFEKITELELHLKLNQGDQDRENTDLKIYVQDLENQRQQQNEKIRQLEVQRVKIIEEQERKYKETEEKFEDEMEAKSLQCQFELKEMQDKSEIALAQLKNFYEIEKETLEQRIGEERDKNARRLTHFQEELELRMRDELQEKDEEIECLQNELSESEQRHQNYVTQMEHELSLKQQMMETLERQVKESRERIDYLEYGKNSAFEKQIEHFEQQRQEYNQKIDKLQIDNLEKDRQLAQIQHKMERLTDDNERKKNDFEQQRQSLEKDKKSLTEKLEATKKKLVEAQDEAMKQKLELGREQALSKQQIEFQNQKIEELQKQTDDSQRFFDEKIKHFKAEIQDEAQAQIERITSEKELWENKYEQKRRALKEIEMSLSKSNNELEKKIGQLNGQIERLEDDRRQMEEQFQDEIQNLNHHIQQLDSNAGAAYYYGSAHAEDVLKYKQQVQDLERELSDLQSTYDRDKALWEGKCQFLETQKETYKRDLNESQKKFELTLEQLQRRGNMDKDKLENNQQSLMKIIESKYKNQIKEMLDTHQCLSQESQQKMKRLENELKLKNEQIQMDARGKMSEYGSLEKKVIEFGENEKRLLMELEEVKNERDRRVQDYQRQLDKDKEAYRQKLNEYEQKAKESESRRASLMFEYEKERAKWQLEKDNLLSIKSDLTEQVEKLQVRKDQLLRENEKLRTENKGSRKYLFGGNASNIPPHSGQISQSSMGGMSNIGQSHHGSTSATRYMVGKSMSTAVGNNILTQAITKMKENNKYIGSGMGHKDEEQVNTGSGTNNTTPNAKQYNRYGH